MDAQSSMSAPLGSAAGFPIRSRVLVHVLHGRNESFLAAVERALGRIPAEARDNSDAELIATILGQTEAAIAQPIMARLDAENAALACEVRRRMTSFDDVHTMDDRSVQVLLRELDSSLLAKALEGASPGTREKIFRNMSKRAAELLQEEMRATGPIRLAEVEEAQATVGTVLRRLESSGAVTVPRARGERLTP